MKKIILVVCFMFLSISSVNAAVVKVSGDKAEAVVQLAADEALDFLETQKEDWDDQVVEDKFSEILSKHFNVNYIAKASLGQYWKKASDTEKAAYLDVFEDNIVKVYSVRFKEYTDQVIEVEKSSVRGRGDVIVFSRVVSGNGDQPPLDVDWRVRLQKDGSYKIIDLDVAGVSMLITQKNEYRSIIEQNGGKVQALIDELEDIVANN
jgi:phospholipid transport system substrate-binding protein